MFVSILIFTLIFLVFVECYVGSVMFRRNSENKLYFNLESGLNFLYHPLHNSFLWNTQGLLMNYPFMLTLFVIVNLILRYHKNNTNHGFLERLDKDSTNTNT